MSEPTHEPFDGLASLYALGALTERERATFEEHLEVCRACVDDVMSLLPLTHRLAAAAPLREPRADLRARVIQAVTGSPPQTNAGNIALPLVAPAPASASAMDRAAPPRRTGGAARLLFRLAAAALLIVAVGLGWFAAQQFNLARALQDNLDGANRRATLAELEVTTAQRAAAESRQRAAILAAPDALTIGLAGQPAAPDAVARVFWSATEGVVFTAAGLPALPAGRVYQLWFVPNASPVSAGLLTVDDGGRVAASVARPDDVTAPVPMAVTLEPEGGVDSPTGEVYLLGRPSG